MDKQEFESGYASRSGFTLDRLYELGGRAEVCECGEDDCAGWQMVFPEHNESLQAASAILGAFNEERRRRTCELEQSTLQGAFRRLHEAWLEFVLTLAYSLGIHHICSWLARMIRRLTPGRRE
jgi:hypothetical protein